MEVRRLAAMLVCFAFVAQTSPARAECYTKECVYAAPVGVALGGVTAIIGGAISIGDESPDDGWPAVGYAFGVLNLLMGGAVLVAAAYADSPDEAELLYGLGGADVGLGALAIFTGALAEAHGDAVKKLNNQAVSVTPLVDGETVLPSGASLSVRF